MTSTVLKIWNESGTAEGIHSSRPVPRKALDATQLVEKRWKLLPINTTARAALSDDASAADPARFHRNIENFIGTVKLPVGLAGPLHIRGEHASGHYYLPLATTEAALVASFSRGAQLITESGGCLTAVLSEAVSRTPGFAFGTLHEAAAFCSWLETQREHFRVVAANTTRFGHLTTMRSVVEGNNVYVDFQYETGDAAGQNMVTFATEAVCRDIVARTPVAPRYWFIEANLSGDKKASARVLSAARGRRVSAEVRVPGELVRSRLHTTTERLVDYWRMAALGGVQAGTIGVQGQYANGLVALYIACGQDPACVAESATGITRFEVTEDGALYASVTLPNVIVGTVGGGTGLPSQAACLEILRCSGQGSSRILAEICAGTALAGELSICGAMCSHDFARAHAERARGAALAGTHGGRCHD